MKVTRDLRRPEEKEGCAGALRRNVGEGLDEDVQELFRDTDDRPVEVPSLRLLRCSWWHLVFRWREG